MVPLSEIARCFEGEIPALMATSSPDGEPNLAHLSRVYLVDDHQVATSNQFFTKTVANLPLLAEIAHVEREVDNLIW